jgi:Protein kinase domain
VHVSGWKVWRHEGKLDIVSLMTIGAGGYIHSINPAFSKCLFGRNDSSLIESEVTTLLPEFWQHYESLVHLERQSSYSGKAPLKSGFSSSLSNISQLAPTPYVSMHALHVDGSKIKVTVTMRPHKGLSVLWVAYYKEKKEETRLHGPRAPIKRSQTVPIKAMSSERETTFHNNLPLYDPDGEIESYQVVKTLGEGTYGFVNMGYHKSDPMQKPVVIKYILKSKVLCWNRRPDLGGRAPSELGMMYDLTKIPHRGIPSLLTSFQDEFFVYIVMPHKGNQDLFDWIETNDPTSEQIKMIFTQVLSVVNHLHSNNIVHRDIKVS